MWHISGIHKHRFFLAQIQCTLKKSWAIALFRGRFRDARPFDYGTFCKKSLGGIIKKAYLIFAEQDQSPQSNLRMFKFDNKLISKKKTCNGNH